jgi:hypothetical protein
MPGSQEMVTVVVNGAPVQVRTNENAALESLIAQALELSHNNGQPPPRWDLKDAAGNVLDPQRKLRDLGLPAGSMLFLSLKAGVGGHD